MPHLQPRDDARLDRSSTKRQARKPRATLGDVESKDWTIKRLSPETIEVTREAARLSGMKINAWVGKALEAAAATRNAENEDSDHADQEKTFQLERSILQEIAQLREQNADLVQTVNSMSAILLKMYTGKVSS